MRDVQLRPLSWEQFNSAATFLENLSWCRGTPNAMLDFYVQTLADSFFIHVRSASRERWCALPFDSQSQKRANEKPTSS